MEVKPPPFPEYREHQREPTSEYRVVLWEQPEMDDTDPELIGWGELTTDLAGAQDVHEAIEWAERQFVENAGPYSRGGTPVRDHEYVLYARVPNEDRFVQIAGWDPTVNAPPEPPYNLPRRSPPTS